MATLLLFVFSNNTCWGDMGPPYVVGVDGGTEGIRAGVFDLEGNALAFASTSYSTNFPKPGWAEQVCPVVLLLHVMNLKTILFMFS